ncbi:MAG TPA: heme-binding protein, partial [Casimicrobiaceae bacterium]
MFPCIAFAWPSCTFPTLPSFATLTTTLRNVVNAQNNGGFGLPMWATIVSRQAIVCTVTRSAALGAEWPGSRVISAQKANTANAFSLPGLALSTANLYSAVQPGGSLFGLQESNPVDPAAAYAGNPELYGTVNDALVGNQVGGVNV